jgi:exodeoxyribonuclease VII small subunit
MAKQKQPTETKESARYQTMLEDVEAIIRSINSSPMDLDEVVEKVEKGYVLIKTMRERLEQTKSKVEKLRSNFESELPTGKNNTRDEKPESSSDESDDDSPF